LGKIIEFLKEKQALSILWNAIIKQFGNWTFWYRSSSLCATPDDFSPQGGGVGLNLTQANHGFHYDRWWNPTVENQATERAFRIGQTRSWH
jgi:hypothetical protein